MKRTGFKYKETHKTLKRSPFTGARKPVNPLGKSMRSIQRREWEFELKLWVAENLPYICEMCGTVINLSKAHSKKRRYIYTKADYFEIAILCTTPFYWQNEHGETEMIMGCHGKIERLPHAEMEAKVKEIVAQREI